MAKRAARATLIPGFLDLFAWRDEAPGLRAFELHVGTTGYGVRLHHANWPPSVYVSSLSLTAAVKEALRVWATRLGSNP
jgi:hypothetical protein